jgi:hypothetical protein
VAIHAVYRLPDRTMCLAPHVGKHLEETHRSTLSDQRIYWEESNHPVTYGLFMDDLISLSE